MKKDIVDKKEKEQEDTK
jgi:hypothetical protein